MSEALRAGRPIAIDSVALIDFLWNAPPVADVTRAILFEPDVQKIMSTVSPAEMTTRLARTGDYQGIATVQRDLAALPTLTIVDFDQRHAIEAAYVRAATGLKLPDAAIIATARLAGATALIGNDRQWRNKPLGVTYHHMDDILALA